MRRQIERDPAVGDGLARWGLLFLSGTLLAGYVKETPLFAWVPGDLTALCAGLTGLFAVAQIGRAHV